VATTFNDTCGGERRQLSTGGREEERKGRRASDERCEFASGSGLAGSGGANNLGLGVNVLRVGRDGSAPVWRKGKRGQGRTM
jgi:hypothetical protein